MLAWLVNEVQEIPNDLRDAYNRIRRKMRVDRYRSRSLVTDETVRSAYSWMALSVLTGENLETPDLRANYITRALTRGTDTAQAVTEALSTINGALAAEYPYTILTFNSGSAAAAADALCEYFTNDESYTELPIRPTITTTPNHKVFIYKRVDNGRIMYVLVNNMDTPTIVWRVAGAILNDVQFFGEATAPFADAYLQGDGQKICEAVTNYYRAYNEVRQQREFDRALAQLERNMGQTREREFRQSIEDAESRLEDYYTHIADWTRTLNERKAAYLLYKLTNEDQRMKDLKDFIASGRDKISHVSYTQGFLRVVYRTPLLYFEPQAMQRYFDSTRPNVANEADASIQQLLKDLFINQTWTLLMETGVQLGIERAQVQFLNPLNVLNIMDKTQLTGMFNPHHYYYNCWGDNQSLIIRALGEHDYMTAILQSFAAMAGINITDSAVMEKFVTRELGEFDQVACLQNKETKEIITIAEYRRRYRHGTSNTND